MSKNKINILFFMMVIASACLTAFFFLQWNNGKEIESDIKNKLVSYYLDRCEFNNDNIIIQGWAVLPGKNNVITSVYAEKTDGKFVKIEKSTQARLDVSKALGVEKIYDISGFLATRLIFKNDSYTRNVMIVSHGDDGEQYAAINKCK